MKKLFTILLIFIGVGATYAQVGIGTLLPNNSAQLDVVASDKGLLIPRLPLTSSLDATSIAAGNVLSLFVFNTATVTGDVAPGYYYWDGAKWQRITNVDDVVTLILDNETVTSISQDAAAGTITYIDEDGDSTVLDIAAIIKQHETLTTVTFDPATGFLIYTDEDGVATSIDLGAMIPNFETLTSISQDTAAGTITYIDEDGVATVLDIVAIIKQHETLTSATFDPVTGILTYNDEDGIATNLDLSAMVPNFETTTSMTQDDTMGIIEYVDEDGNSSFADVTSVDAHNLLTTGTDGGSFLDPASIEVEEPWFGSDDNTGATTNTEDIYHFGKIGIGTDTPLESLDIHGTDANGGDADVDVSSYGDNLTSLHVNRAGGTRLAPTAMSTLTSNEKNIFSIEASGYDGISYVKASSVLFGIKYGATGPLDMPGFIEFRTTPDGASSPITRMNVIENGDVGIGIGSIAPSNRLHVVATADPVRLEGLQTGAPMDKFVVADVNGVLKTVDAPGGGVVDEPWFGVDDNMGATLNTEDIYHMGKIGIGTDTPLELLDIRGTDATNGDADVDVTSYGINLTSLHVNRAGGTPAAPTAMSTLTSNEKNIFSIEASGYDGTNFVKSSSILFGIKYGATGPLDMPGFIEFRTTPDGASSPITRMNVIENGNVGIGVNIPSVKLEVNGKIKATDVNFSGLPTFANEAAATVGGLATGDMYKTVAGDLKIKL